MFEDADFAGDLADSKETSKKGVLCIFGSHTFAPFLGGLVRNRLLYLTVELKQKSFHLDAGLRLDGIPALSLWDTAIDALEPHAQEQPDGTPKKKKQQVSKNNGVKQLIEDPDVVFPCVHTSSQRASLHDDRKKAGALP